MLSLSQIFSFKIKCNQFLILHRSKNEHVSSTRFMLDYAVWEKNTLASFFISYKLHKNNKNQCFIFAFQFKTKKIMGNDHKILSWIFYAPIRHTNILVQQQQLAYVLNQMVIFHHVMLALNLISVRALQIIVVQLVEHCIRNLVKIIFQVHHIVHVERNLNHINMVKFHT